MKKNRILSLLLAVLFVLSLVCFASCKPQLDILPNARFVAKVTEVSLIPFMLLLRMLHILYMLRISLPY